MREVGEWILLERGGGTLAVKPYDGKCHKRGFSSQAKAKKHLKQHSGKHTMASNIYQCPHEFCDLWHFTKRKVEDE
jgi:hypothetical protein